MVFDWRENIEKFCQATEGSQDPFGMTLFIAHGAFGKGASKIRGYRESIIGSSPPIPMNGDSDSDAVLVWNDELEKNDLHEAYPT